MRRRARTDLCGGRFVRTVPTATLAIPWLESELPKILPAILKWVFPLDLKGECLERGRPLVSNRDFAVFNQHSPGAPNEVERSRKTSCYFQEEPCHHSYWQPKDGSSMAEKPEVLQGTLALMVLKTLDLLGSQHGWGIARSIEQINGDLLGANQGTLYPLLLKLEHEGVIASQWGVPENNRKARFYSLTAAGRKQLQTEIRDWEQTAAIIARFFNVKVEDLA
jgi:PadR family transcriptional regulator, regulatory protein PadR